MSTKRPAGPGPDNGRHSGGDLPQRIGSAHDPAEPLPPGTQRYLTPAARQQQAASDGGQRQPGSGEARREQYGQHGGGTGQPSQFGGASPQQHAGHSAGSPVRSGGTQDPRHAEGDDYAAPWGQYGGEYGQFDRSPSRQQAFGQQDLGFGREARADSAREGKRGPGASQPWRADDDRSWQDGGSAGGHPYAPGQYGAADEQGPPASGDPAWRDHDTQGSQDWQGYSGGQGWQPGGRGGWGGAPQQAGRHAQGAGYGGETAGGYGGPGSYGGRGGPYGASSGYGGEPFRGTGGPGEPRRSGGGWPQGGRSGSGSGGEAGPPVRDPSHDWGSRDAEPWGSRHRDDDRSFDNPYGRRDGHAGPQLGEHQGSPYAGGRRGGIGQRAGGAAGGWDPSEHHGGRYGAQGFGASGRGGTGWSTPPGAGQPDNRPWDEQRSRNAEHGPASWGGQTAGSGWRGEPGSGPSGDAQGWRGRHEPHQGGEPGQHARDHQGHQGEAHHDPDYHQWRAEQLRSFDDDYRQWRQERYRRFSDEFNEWRQGRTRGSQQPSASESGDRSPTGGPDTTPGGARGSTGQPDRRLESPAGLPGQAHDVGVSGSTHAGSKTDEQGAAQGRTLPSAGGESRETTGTSGGTGQTAAPRDGKPGKGKER
jgi:hypothetical protein